jgi:hypothetical protein
MRRTDPPPPTGIEAEIALTQVAANTKMEALPAGSTDATQAGEEDRLARQIVLNPTFWAAKFSEDVAVQLIGKTTLLDEVVTTDADIFSAVSAVFDKFIASPA